ncbi:MAG: ABC transporter permease [Actinomycetota bacterium]|nr:ABC transporter permease [Actinomycetota bacterium]
MKALAGTGPLVRLILRRDRILLPLWVAVLAVTPVAIANTLADLYPTDAERQAYLDIVTANPALTALYGRAFGSGLGALTTWRLAGTVLLVGLASLLTVVRHTRAEEEAGRRELLGATVVGRQAPLFAALVVAFGANLLLGAVAAGGLVAYGLPAAGSAAFGLSWAMFGWTFAAVAAVAAQATEGARAARIISVAVLGVCFLLRAAGDAGERGWLIWLSPLGWAQRVHPFAYERWWVFALFAALVTVLVAAAYGLSARRDLGSGLLPARPGPAAASPLLRGPLALAWRLHRGALIAWAAGFAVFGAVFGSVTQSAVQIIDTSPQMRVLAERLGGSSGLADTWFAVLMGLLGLVVSGYAIGAALRLRSEESSGHVEPVLAASVSRLRWAASHLTFTALGPAVVLGAAGLAAGLTYGLSVSNVGRELPRVLAAAEVQLPAVWVLAGLAVALFGLLPRFVASVGWGVLAACTLLEEFGRPLQLSERVLDLSPFVHLPKLPGGDVSAAPLVWLTLVSVTLAAVGILGLRRRDVL